MASRQRRRSQLWFAVPLLLAGFALRIWGLTDHNIWWDEGIGVWLARMPLLEAIRWTAGDVHPPLHYISLIGWRAVAGESTFALRFLSVLFSFLTLPLIYRLGRALGGSSTGLLAIGLLAISRFSIWWAQEIRMYALSALLATGALWSSVWLWRVMARDRSRALPSRAGRSEMGLAWATYVLTTLGSLSTLYLTATVPVVTNLGFLVFWWHRRAHNRALRLWPWVSAQLAVVAIFLPWVAYALPRMHGWSSDAPFTPGFFIRLYTTILAVGDPLNLEANAALTAGVFAGLTAGLAALVHALRRSSSPRWGGFAMLLAGLLLPPLVVALVSLPGLSFYFSRPLVPRYLLPLSACYVTLLAWSIDAWWRSARRRLGPPRWLAGAVALLALTAATAGLRTFYPHRTPRDDYATIAELLSAHRRADEAVLLYVDRDWPIFTAHYPGPRTDLPYGAALSDPAVVKALLEPVWDQTAAVWLVSTPESLQTDPRQTVPAWLAARSVMSRTLVSGEASLTYYTRTPERVPLHHTVVPGYTPPLRLTTAYGLVGAHLPLPRYTTGDTLRLGLYWIPPLPQTAQVHLSHPAGTRVFDVPPVTATTDIVSNRIDIPLTPELPGGRYHLSVLAPGHPPTPIGAVTLVHQAAGAAVDAAAIPHPVDVRFAGGIRLIGYALPEHAALPGESFAVTLYWQAEQPVAARYKVFTHLVGTTYNAATGNFLWGQQDNEPLNGQAPTTRWTPGTVIADPYRIPAAPHAPPGPYTLTVGLYGLLDGQRLPVHTASVPTTDNGVHLTTVTLR